MSFRQLPVPGPAKSAPVSAPAPKSNTRRRQGGNHGAPSTSQPCDN